MIGTSMLSKDKVNEILRNNGIRLAEVAANPVIFDKACNTVYKRLPLPWRWIVGKKRVTRLMTKLREQLPQTNPQQEAQLSSKVSGNKWSLSIWEKLLG